MHFWDLLSLIKDNLGRRKGRVAMTAVGVVIGTAAVVVLVSLGIGLQTSATSQLYGIGDLTKIDVYQKMGDRSSGKSGATLQVKALTPQIVKEISQLNGVSKVLPVDFLSGGGSISYGQMETWPNIIGVDTHDLSDLDLKVAEGELSLAKGTAVIGSWVPKSFYNPKQSNVSDKPVRQELLGKRLTLTVTRYTQSGETVTKKYPIMIVGVLEETRSESDGSFYMNLDDVSAMNEWLNGKRMNRNKDGYTRLIVKAENADVVLGITKKINDMGFMASTAQEYVKGINSFFTVLQLVFGGIGAISLLVAAIGIANTMTMAILERTREIGLMKAVGASNKDVLSIFLGEAAGIGFIGGAGGVVLGWVAGRLVNAVGSTYLSQSMELGGASLAAVTPVWLPVFAILFATAVGLLSGLYPALRAATLEPMVALKYE